MALNAATKAAVINQALEQVGIDDIEALAGDFLHFIGTDIFFWKATNPDAAVTAAKGEGIANRLAIGFEDWAEMSGITLPPIIPPGFTKLDLTDDERFMLKMRWW